MVIVNDQKFACQSCIKGHRSSACNHADRPLFEIRKKGRPATQCDKCRDLRRTKRLHVKCACDGRRDPESEIGPVQIQPPTNGNRFGRKIPLIPKLPNGVRDMDISGSDATKTLSTPSTRSRSASISDETSEVPIERIRPIRSCCSHKAASSPQTISEDCEIIPQAATKSPSASSSLGLEFLLRRSDAHPSTTSTGRAQATPQPSQMPDMMECLCGPACLCLGCTKHQQNAAEDTIMVHGDSGCPPDCPSCIDNQCGPRWPAAQSSHSSGSTVVISSGLSATSNWLTSMPPNGRFALDLDADGEYDDEMDAEGSPDPAFCDLPEERAPHTIAFDTKQKPATVDGAGGMRSAVKSCCAGKRQSPKLNNGTAEATQASRRTYMRL